ncbi:pseudouridine synthase [Mycoplasma tauri]|uniref:pseudouridine synthase n=1 Tax=Mycoplasma tauri TaxID=547987 RepID=UPI00196769BF|nr:pseudouridine synthase [Mycoplasma tauri]MBZ4204332.1 rRNA pseudouridine synthase [Mycoplasma tauri]MBZ4226598.1 rRNA pseudouridine synthase [Mycoplasma tauri]QSB07596.1 rRNA pseudouridine synthase [Mycoplasma tauri]
MKNLIRVQKIIAQSGIASRRAAEQLIIEGKVLINGKKALLGDKASFDDEIKVNNKIIHVSNSKNFIYILLNKPKNTITTVKDPNGRKTVIDLIETKERIVPVGRLDRDTTGALLLTTDYELVNKLTHPRYEIQRTYRVRIDEPLSLRKFKELNSGVIVNGKMSYQIVDQVETKSYLVTLHVGSYHHVKKLFESIGHKVINLKRVSFANLNVEKMQEGSYRALSFKELKDLKSLIKMQELKWEKKQN